jgi:hypothetical protein
MNLNQKLVPILADGIPGYNKKINEIEVAVNWLLGMRTSNGPPITESDQGPIINLSQGPAAQAPGGDQPWLTAPNGEAAQWSQVTVLDKANAQVYDLWAWTSKTHMNINNALWLKDPNGVAAQWVQHDVCVGGSVVSKWFWGTP